MRWLHSLRRRLWPPRLPPVPLRARHAELSVIASADDDAGPDDFLLDLAIRAVTRARTVSVDHVVRRMRQRPYYPAVWPGEHYKLLAALVEEHRPRTVVEVGTSTGLSALTMLPHLGPDGRLVSFDVVPWRQFADSVLTEEDFADGRLLQEIADLGDRDAFGRHADLIRGADLIFLDGPKDGVFEGRFLAHLEECRPAGAPLLVLDDTRVWNMLRLWREIARPKLDLTSFGHWSGTGLVHWVGS